MSQFAEPTDPSPVLCLRGIVKMGRFIIGISRRGPGVTLDARVIRCEESCAPVSCTSMIECQPNQSTLGLCSGREPPRSRASETSANCFTAGPCLNCFAECSLLGNNNLCFEAFPTRAPFADTEHFQASCFAGPPVGQAKPGLMFLTALCLQKEENTAQCKEKTIMKHERGCSSCTIYFVIICSLYLDRP